MPKWHGVLPMPFRYSGEGLFPFNLRDALPPALTCNAASAPSGGNPPGEAAKRRLPLLQLLAVAPPRRVAAPRQSTLGDLSHSQIEWEQALAFQGKVAARYNVAGAKDKPPDQRGTPTG